MESMFETGTVSNLIESNEADLTSVVVKLSNKVAYSCGRTGIIARELAEDIMQDMWLAIFAKETEALTKDNPLGYLISTAKGAALRHHRKQQYASRFQSATKEDSTEAEFASASYYDHLEGKELAPVDAITKAETEAAQHRRIENLDSRSLAVVVCRFEYGMSQKDTADCLDIPRSTVQHIETKALETL